MLAKVCPAAHNDAVSEYFVAPTPAKRRGLPWWGWTLIAAGVVLVIGFVVLPVLGIIAYVNHSLRETSPDQPFIEGAPQRPDAVSPLECPEQCFDIDSASLVAVSAAEVARLSITDEVNAVGELEPSTVSAVAPDVGDYWLELGGDAECAFIPVNAPYIAVGPDSTSEDPVRWVQTWETGYEMTDLAARIFPTTEDASAFMRDIHDRVTACPWQDTNVPVAGGLDTSLVQITAQAAIEVPSEVAAVGWVREGEPGPRWRSYVWDLQRGNLVIQVRVLTDGTIVEQEVAAYAELVAERLGELEPALP
jgi:hypothetical protein